MLSPSLWFLVKTLLTAVIIASISELSRRYSVLAAALASLPLISILSFIWIYTETGNTQKVINMSYDIFWLVLPSLAFFLILPILLKNGMAFGWAMLLSCIGMSVLYAIMIWLLKNLN